MKDGGGGLRLSDPHEGRAGILRPRLAEIGAGQICRAPDRKPPCKNSFYTFLSPGDAFRHDGTGYASYKQDDGTRKASWELSALTSQSQFRVKMETNEDNN